MSDCTCPTDQSRVCDDCAGMVEHLDHQAVRVCAYRPCSKPLTRREGEQLWRFRQRLCCGASCANRRATGSTAPLELPIEKTCAECGATFGRRDNEAPSRWVSRSCCSRRCASRRSVRLLLERPREVPIPEVKACARCGAQMVRRVGERTNKWATRKFCCRVCRYRQGSDVPKARRPKAQPKASRPVRPPRQSPSEPVLTLAELRPDPAVLLPDPEVVDMDRRRREAHRMLDEGAPPHRIARLIGVSVAQVNRWDRGAR